MGRERITVLAPLRCIEERPSRKRALRTSDAQKFSLSASLPSKGTSSLGFNAVMPVVVDASRYAACLARPSRLRCGATANSARLFFELRHSSA